MASLPSDASTGPLCQEIPLFEPGPILTHLSRHPYLAFLDSARRDAALGRYSYLACDPFLVFRSVGGKTYVNDRPLREPPFVALQSLLTRYKLPSLPAPVPPFQGGAIGYVSYEAGRLLEKLPRTSQEAECHDDICLPFYDVLLAIDHFPSGKDIDAGQLPDGRAFLLSSGWPETGTRRLERAQIRLDWFKAELEAAIATAPTASPSMPPRITGWRSNFSKAGFEAAIRTTQHHIREGDIFQANLTQRFSAPVLKSGETTPLDCYLALRSGNPAPFAAYLDNGDHVIASSSPERFITLSADGHVETRPIKGTAPRDLDDPDKDAALAHTLAASEKDRAENIMITDLMRNDLSRVCQPGSVAVPQLCGLESYARVHHLVSVITAKMKPGLGAVALLGASFPGGSITGAPKIRAMEIITALEDLPRGVYCGSIGYIGFDGAMDTNIAIRTVTFRDGMAHVSVGGGITILSDPASEYEETLHKASAILRSLGTSVEAERTSLAQGPDGAQQPHVPEEPHASEEPS